MTDAHTPAGEPESLDPELLDIIVCPACHAGLVPLPDAASPRSLRCVGSGCGLLYPVRGGIPVLLVDEAGPGD